VLYTILCSMRTLPIIDALGVNERAKDLLLHHSETEEAEDKIPFVI